MKIKSIFLLPLTLGLTARNKEESLSQDGLPVNAVRITATVGNPFATTHTNPVGTAEEQAKFNSGDKILVEMVSNNYKKIDYQYDGGKWMPVKSKHHLWANNNETFIARYPIDKYGDAVYRAQENQSTLEKITKSDLMVARIINASKGETLNFVMLRLTSRIIVNIAGFNPEFPTDSKVKDVMIVKSYAYSSNCHEYIPYLQGDGGKNSKCTLLLEPNGGGSVSSSYFDSFISLKVGEKEMRSPNLPDMDEGKSYTFNLIVGKEKLEIESVAVADWSTSNVLEGGKF